MTLPIAVATFLIIAGITLLSLRDASVKQFQPIYLLYPLTASMLAGCSQVLRKVGMGAVPHPILAAAVTASSSFVVLLLTLWIVEKKQEMLKLNRQCLPWYLSAGVAVSVAMTSIYYALDLGKVTVVIPVASTGPFFSLVLSALFLRDVERVTLKIVLGAAVIVGGVILLTLWK